MRSTAATRPMSLRATMMLVVGGAFAFVAVVGSYLAARVGPRARELSERSEIAQRDYAERSRYVGAVDSLAGDVRQLTVRSRLAPLPLDSLELRRLHLEGLLRGSVILAPAERQRVRSAELSRKFELADERATRMVGALLGAVGLLEAGDQVAAEQLSETTSRLRGPMAQAMSELTGQALAELTAEELRLADEAQSVRLLVLGWFGIGFVVMLLLWRFITQRWVTPLRALDESLSRIQAGDLDASVDPKQDDEMGRLGRHFNRTTEMLRAQRIATEQAAALAGQEASEAGFRAAFEQAEVGFAEIDTSRRYIRVNAALCRLLGRQEEEIIGHTFTEFTHPDDMSGDDDAWERLFSGRSRGVQLEKRYLRGDGTVAIGALTVTLLRDTTGRPRHTLAVVHDVTEQRRLERELQQTQKLDAVGQLAGGVAHDFNNILQAISGYAQLLDEDLPLGSSAADDVAAIRQAAERGADLARGLLAVGRRTQPKHEAFALRDVVRETAELAQRTFDRRIALRVNNDVDAVVQGDRSLIANALLNLSLNARDAMPEGGVLRLETRVVEPDATFRERYQLRETGAYATVSVHDTGVGMTPQVMEHIFEPFFTTKEAGKGTGLGLAMVYGTAREHDGAVLVESAPGRGTTFTLFLPCHAGPATLVTAPRVTKDAMAAARILVVDDETMVRQTAMRLLARLGHLCEGAVDGVEALERLSIPTHGFDLILLDGNMPRLNGLETARRIKALHPYLPIVYASGFLQPETDAMLASLGYIERLTKPYTAEALGVVVARALGRSREL